MRAPVLFAAAVVLAAACTGVPAEDSATSSGPLLSSGGVVGFPDGGVANPGPSYADGTFFIHALGNRCWDVGPQYTWKIGSPVTLSTCNYGGGQQIRVKEIDGSHDVLLMVQSSYCIGIRGRAVTLGMPLELETCDTSAAQRFAYDGDAILVGPLPAGFGIARPFAIEPAGDVTENQPPLAVGARDASDAEYFRMQHADGGTAYPHTGFVHVSTEAELDAALKAEPGTVIEIDDAQPLLLTGTMPKVVRSRVTVRGYRKHLARGPEIVAPDMTGAEQEVFDLPEPWARVTGLRLTGPSDSEDKNPPFIGITLHDGNPSLVDDVEAQKWTHAAIQFVGTYDNTVCPVDLPALPRPTPARVLRSHIHSNERDSLGYGVVVYHGAFGDVEGNLFWQNRHAIAADGRGLTGYQAWDNFVLNPAPAYGTLGNHEQDFDKHGTDVNNDYYGGTSDDVVDIGWNTFLGTNRHNVEERGTPCRHTTIHDNVLRGGEDRLWTNTVDPADTIRTPNAFNVDDPTFDLGVGDFDGDGTDDLFVGTGATWWFSSGGQTEWRYLRRSPERAKAVRIGDFDGDGRADVLAVHGANVDVSWAGLSDWRTINVVGWPVEDLAVGDFDGDHRADLFLATGQEWFYAPGGRNWMHFADAAHTTDMLRFGDFDHDGKTDVFGVVGKEWAFVPGGGSFWQMLGPALATTVDGLYVADFDGDQFADVVRQTSDVWEISARGTGTFAKLRDVDGEEFGSAFVGRFDGDAKADVLRWRTALVLNELVIAPAGKSPTRVFPRAPLQ